MCFIWLKNRLKQFVYRNIVSYFLSISPSIKNGPTLFPQNLKPTNNLSKPLEIRREKAFFCTLIFYGRKDEKNGD
ncbi:MAG: hypothetical protein CMC96_13340 [Flavobacteriales bacterium]|nr:hypothetical protein [Flavobacteriales bacterium]